MLPVTHPTFTNPFNGFGDCKVSYLSSVSGLVAWTDYIPVRTVTASTSIEGRTEANGYQNVHSVGATGNVAWTDYIPVYEDATKTVPWSTDANGYIPVGMSEDGVLGFLSQAEFAVELTHTAVPTAAAVGTTATFTRATTKTVENNDGYSVTLLAGEIGFPGARRVRNLLPSTEGAFNAGAGWIVLNGSVTSGITDPDGGTSAYTLKQTGAASCELYPTTPFSGIVLSSLWVRRRTGTGAIRLYGGDAFTVITGFVTTEWQRLASNATTSSLVGFDLRLFDANDEIDFWHPQAEDITGRTDQTTPSEYVSVGVESAPYYHGSFVDGVKCFPTDLAGNALTTMRRYNPEGARTNLCLQSNAFTTTWTETGTVAATQNLVGPDGGTTGWTLTDNDAGTPEGILQTYGALTAANYAQSIFIKKTSGATSFPVIRLNEPVTPKEALCTVDTNNGIATVWTAYTGSTIVTSSASCVSHNAEWWRVTLVFAATTDSWRIVFYPAATTNATQSTGTVSATVTGTCGIYGSQLELGSSASSYTATTTAAVTRDADVLTYSSAGNIDGTKGWCYAEISTNWSIYTGSTRSAIGFGAAIEGILSGGVSGVPTEIRAYDGTNSVTASGNPTMYQTPRKTVLGWGSALTITQTGVTASGTFDGNIGTTAIGVGCSATGTQVWDGNIGPIYIGQRQLSASELQAITAA